MVDGVLQFSRAQVALAVSGIAGPSGARGKAGRHRVVRLGTNDAVRTACHQLDGDRMQSCESVHIALLGVINLLNIRTKTA